MLVLSRKAGEELIIAEEIVVKVVRIKQNSVQLGITCDRDIPIVRAELAFEPPVEVHNPAIHAAAAETCST